MRDELVIDPGPAADAAKRAVNVLSAVGSPGAGVEDELVAAAGEFTAPPKKAPRALLNEKNP